MRGLRVILGTLILPAAAAATDARASGPPPATVQACAAIAADAERLACYDRLAGHAAPATAAPPQAALAPVAPAAPVAATSASSATVAAPPAQSFGLYPAEHPRPPPAAKFMTARIVEMGTSAAGHPTVALEGGQLWELNDADPLLAVGDTVIISRATLGSFLMQTPGKRSHRVHRLR